MAATSDSKKPSFKEYFWLTMLIFLVIITRIYFLDMGFGRPDAWRVGVTGKIACEQREYEPSRPPGFPLTELIATMGYSIFGSSSSCWIFSNLMTCVAFIASVWGIWLLGRKWGTSNALGLASIYAFAPLNWVYSVETIDYLWMTSFLIWSVCCLESGRRRGIIFSAVLLGLACASRFSAIILILPLLWIVWIRIKKTASLLTYAVITVMIVLISYSIVLISVKDWSVFTQWARDIDEIAGRLAQTRGSTFTVRYLMPASSLFGPLASIGILSGLIFGFTNGVKKLRDGDMGLITNLVICIFIMAPYVWHLHPNYWIPAIGFILLILSKIIRPGYFVIIGCLIILSGFPFWQTQVEGLQMFSRSDGNASIDRWTEIIAPYQNENVFHEMRVRQMILEDALNVLSYDVSENSVIMTTTRQPIVQFLTEGTRSVEVELYDGRMSELWGLPDHGPYYKYLVSPSQASDLIRSGYRIFYPPGTERAYWATYGVRIESVEGLELLSNQPGRE